MLKNLENNGMEESVLVTPSPNAAGHADNTAHWTQRQYERNAFCRMAIRHLWPLLLTWFNFNPSMDK